MKKNRKIIRDRIFLVILIVFFLALLVFKHDENWEKKNFFAFYRDKIVALYTHIAPESAKSGDEDIYIDENPKIAEKKEQFSPQKLEWTVGDADLRFSLNLLHLNLKSEKDNFVISPFSIYSVLCLLANGAEGKSLEELMRGLLSSSENTNVENLTYILSYYLQNVNSVVEINNSVWADNLSYSYKSSIKKIAEIKALPEYTDEINKWVKKKTNGKINNLLDNIKTREDSVYFINTIYFKDRWIIPFEKRNTRVQPFYSLNAEQPDDVNMMYAFQRDIQYYENEKMQAVKLYYRNSDFIQIFLPKKEVDFQKFVSELTVSDLDVDYNPRDVMLLLPRFEISKEHKNVKVLLKHLGISEIFSDKNRDLMPMSKNLLFVNNIVHVANIKVDEEGTVATAATGVEVLLEASADMDDSVVFNANRPFVFMIDNGLFVGAYVKGSMN